MTTEHDNTLHLTHLSQSAVRELAPSFEQLPHTEHADGKFRLRRYSVIRFVDQQVVPTEKHDFTQSETYNHYQGGVKRNFEPLLNRTIESKGLKELCELFVELNHLPNGQEIEIHQMRIAPVFDETPVSPEGVHQDGFDCIAMIGINRQNVVGGELMIYQGNHDAPFYRKVLDDGEIAMLADHELWHNASPIRAVKNDGEGHMDVFVMTANRNRALYHS
ncbi:2OG-Fe dioxygenase family protein [Vibrio viridaestus]|uniref:2OG-Fe dioxygenase family protein n=1 Tax=Vibrio viridaestus TaxID=2487322 RepID=UPI00140E2F8C|nr:2OG-Fe dioxygenase family protein [Vibrio viridaestus]